MIRIVLLITFYSFPVISADLSLDLEKDLLNEMDKVKNSVTEEVVSGDVTKEVIDQTEKVEVNNSNVLQASDNNKDVNSDSNLGKDKNASDPKSIIDSKELMQKVTEKQNSQENHDINASSIKDDIAEEVSEEVNSEVEEEVEEEDEFVYMIKGSSLLHKKEQIDQLNTVLEALKNGEKILHKDIAQDTEKTTKKKVTKSNMSFYLNSIIYHSKNNWSVWVNGKKITHKKNDSDLHIIKVNKKRIQCRWSTGYGKFVKILTKLKKEELLPDMVSVMINDNIAEIIFTLKPNQSFEISNGVFINEGKAN